VGEGRGAFRTLVSRMPDEHVWICDDSGYCSNNSGPYNIYINDKPNITGNNVSITSPLNTITSYNPLIINNDLSYNLINKPECNIYVPEGYYLSILKKPNTPDVSFNVNDLTEETTKIKDTIDFNLYDISSSGIPINIFSDDDTFFLDSYINNFYNFNFPIKYSDGSVELVDPLIDKIQVSINGFIIIGNSGELIKSYNLV
jgi:hypothetical protein